MAGFMAYGARQPDRSASASIRTVQQDWLKLKGWSSSFLHFLLLLFRSWTLSVRPPRSCLHGMESADIFPVSPILVSVPSDECGLLHLFLLLSISSGSMALTRPRRSLTEADVVGPAVHFPSF